MDDQSLFHELAFYTLEKRDSEFIHQHAVDAYAAQNANEVSKPIAVAFALIGLYLFVERGYSGKQVQRAHMQLAQHRKSWPRLSPPQDRGAITVADVLAAEPGAPRDKMIRSWCASVWQAWGASRIDVMKLVEEELGAGASVK